MSRIVAAIDNSPAARPVLSVALALGPVLGAEVEAVHVADEEGDTAAAVAASMGVPYRVLPGGDPLPALLAHAAGGDVTMVVVGARRRLQSSGLGHLAGQIAESLDKPVVVVPPETRPMDRLQRVVIALEATPAKARSLTGAIEVAAGAELDIVVVHVDDEQSIPSFSDQEAHETRAYADEFLARYLPGAGPARLELRIGDPADEIIELIQQSTVDLLALGWPRDPERGAVARRILGRSHVPVLLI